MQVILDSSFARPGSAPIWGGKKGEFRDWTTMTTVIGNMSKALTINRFEFRPTDSGQVIKLLNKLNKSEGAGLDKLSMQVGLFVNVLTLFRHISQVFLIVV